MAVLKDVLCWAGDICQYEAVPVVAGDDNVNTSAGLADVLGFLVVHFPQ